jgi:hypothetical protein
MSRLGAIFDAEKKQGPIRIGSRTVHRYTSTACACRPGQRAAEPSGKACVSIQMRHGSIIRSKHHDEIPVVIREKKAKSQREKINAFDEGNRRYLFQA